MAGGVEEGRILPQSFHHPKWETLILVSAALRGQS